MAIRDLIPTFGQKRTPARWEDESPFFRLQREMNRMFDEMFNEFGLTPYESRLGGWSGFSPSVDITENDNEYVVSAELPGMDESNIDLSLSDDTLTIKGEKKQEFEDKGDNYFRMERSYGSFRRDIPLPTKIDVNKADAKFKNGVLTVKLPKTPEAKKNVHKIKINSK
ncbi:MAG: Hsp20/alpha crystallin family protein [Gemmatimonadetes bacterium]|nr:MAG: Hsp20/alpha crystallin family protein [Gemmatimonadota bacterium]